MTDTERIDWLERQSGNLFTPTSADKTWAWFGNDGKRRDDVTLRALIDALMEDE